MVASSQVGIGHVMRDLNLYIALFNSAKNNGNQAGALAAINSIVTNAQLVQTVVTAATNATMTTVTVAYTPPDGLAGY